MSSIAKTNISLSKKDLSKSRIPPVASRNVVFYHKTAGGELTINLLSLTMPSADMPTAVQATNPEISGAQLSINKKNLKLVSSSKGELIQDLDYIVIDSYTISLIGPYEGVGAEVDEIFVGTINSAPISDLVVASAKSVDKTYELAIGNTTLNLGREYKVGTNPFENVGSIKVFVNGVLALRDVDYSEVDSGNGYGTTIEFAVAPVSIPHQVAVDFGVMSITDNNAIGAIENLAGSIKKIADDLSVVAGTSATDYYSASPSEVERRTFGDMVLVHEKILDVQVPIVTEWADAGPIQITGSVTDPTKGATTYDSVRYRQVGQDYEVEYKLLTTTAGTAGSGEYFLALPDGIQFDDSVITYTGILNTTSMYQGGAAATIGKAIGANSAGADGEAYPIAYDSTRFRVFRINYFASGNSWNSSFFPLSEIQGITITLKFKGSGLVSNQSIRTMLGL